MAFKKMSAGVASSVSQRVLAIGQPRKEPAEIGQDFAAPRRLNTPLEQLALEIAI